MIDEVHMKRVLSFVLILIMAVSLAACTGQGGNTPDPTQAPTQIPTAAPTQIPTTVPTPDIGSMRIIEGSVGMIWLEQSPRPRGQVRIIDSSLADALEDETNSDALFAVDILFYYAAFDAVSEICAEYHLAVDRAESAPAFMEFYALFTEWIEKKQESFSSDDRFAYNGYGEEAFFEVCLAELYGEVSDEKRTEYAEAATAVYRARHELKEAEERAFYTVEFIEAMDAAIQTLTDKGICLDRSTLTRQKGMWFTVSGYLTWNQLKDFPDDPKEFYCFLFSTSVFFNE